MLGSVKIWSHLVVGLSVVVVAVMAWMGVIGQSSVDQRIEQLHIVATPQGEAGLRVVETIDYDFGTTDRRGYQRVIPNDFGIPTEIIGSSPSAPDDLDVAPAPFDAPVQGTRIRLGDPDITVTGQHRYVISYLLPAARPPGGSWALDAVGAESEIPIEDVSVILNGIQLDDPVCSTGTVGAEGGCSFEPGAPLRVEVDRLEPFEGITVSGRVTSWTSADPIDPPPLPERRPDHGARNAGIVAVLGAISAITVFVGARRSGANEVMGSGPSDAAHGVAGPGGSGVRKVSDAELAEMATIAFAPPKGIEPWQGAVAVSEELDDATVTAWFSGAVADDLIVIEQHDDHPQLRRGPKADQADPVTAHVLDTLFDGREVVDLDGYDEDFASAWSEVERLQETWVAGSGWWWARTPRRGAAKPGGCATFVVLVILVVPVVLLSGFLLGLFGIIGGLVTAAIIGIGFPMLVARVAYAPLRPGRTADGSAYALQVESFRRFLVDSEGQHVEWAWKHGLLRQYSAWAVALDAADAWQAAMERAGVPAPEIQASSPLLVYAMSRSFQSSHTKPVESSGSGGFSSGGFSGGGSVGGGGGGGSHGSW